MRRLSFIFWAICATIACGSFSAKAQDLIGADGVIRQVLSANAKEGESTEVADPFEEALGKWRSSKAGLEAERAAEHWLELLKMALRPEESGLGRYGAAEPRLKKVMVELPEPKHWDALAKKIRELPEGRTEAEKLQNVGLRLLAATLAGDPAGQLKEIESLQPLLRQRPGQLEYLAAHLVGEVLDLKIELAQDADELFAAWKQKLEVAKKNPEEFYLGGDLPLAVGEEKLRELIRDMLLLGERGVFGLYYNEEVKEMVREVALENLDELKEAPWELCDSTEATELFEALEKKFAEGPEVEAEEDEGGEADATPSALGWSVHLGGGDSPRKTAAAFYIAGLVLDGRREEALARAQKPESYDLEMLKNVLYAPELSGAAGRFYNFVEELMESEPKLDLWEAFIPLAARAGRAQEALELLEKRLAADGPEEEKEGLRRQLAPALLAAGEAERGVAELREQVEGEEKGGGQFGYFSAPEMLLMLGRVRENKEWIEDALAEIEERLVQSEYGFSGLPFLVELYTEEEYRARGEKAMAAALKASLEKAQAARQTRGHFGYPSAGGADRLLTALANIYHAAERPDEVMTLLREAPWWGVADLVNLGAELGGYGMHPVKPRGIYPVKFIAAASLISKGDKERGIATLKTLLREQGGFDPGYALYLETAPEEAVVFFRELFELDRFEERPLIWIAQHLYNTREYEEAEKIARQAIEIDPSDGEQGPGDRMRGYAVLAEIRGARGDAEQAEFFRQAVRAIRVAEEADRIYAAGLLSEGIEKYQEALTFFADAYCIQSRLAVQLSELGLHELAEKHYVKAFELMPDSFGRMESHCFGCEGVFQSEQAQNLAERVFTRLLQASPEKPQLHYLSGYLKETQGKMEEALAGYRRAVELDPDYINAWKKLAGLGQMVFLPVEEKDAIAMNLLRLDPLQRHGSIPTGVRNVRAIWPLLQRADEMRPERPKSLLELTAAAEEARESAGSEDRYSTMYAAMNQERSAVEQFVEREPVFRFVETLLQSAGAMGR